MASKTKTEDAPLDELEPAEEIDEIEEVSDLEDEIEDPPADALVADVGAVDAADDAWVDDDGDDDDDGDAAVVVKADDEDDDDTQDLDELETEELEMLTEDELAETLVVDEAAELRAIRRAELAMSGETGTERGADEFLCQGCFLVLRASQLVDKRRNLCVDCAG